MILFADAMAKPMEIHAKQTVQELNHTRQELASNTLKFDKSVIALIFDAL